jgi:cytochrome c oxidase assembly protein subunit 15
MERLNAFLKISYVTLIVLFLLIGVGGIVRVTGSGMGCPDWPKCFGLWVPPTCECQLPQNYHQLYKDHGYPEGTYFDPVKTWIEYMNRLLGVLSGFFVLITFYQAYKIRKGHKAIYHGMVLCLLLVLLEGGIGALVVKLNLQQQSVTLHYFLAIALVSSLLYSIAAARKTQSDELAVADKKARIYLLSALAITTLQLISGTNMRSITESLSGITTYQWLQQNDIVFIMHRFYAVIIVVSNYLLWRKFRSLRFANISMIAIGVSVIMQIITGLMLNYFNIPRIAQIVHILLPAVLFCSQFYILSYLIIKKEAVIVSV